ncbi:hypothetical protein HDA41_001053 [Streptomyces caelestis]|jgi:hypothetical protein|uniref:Uncharacterized protein n=1 Tax=Streptomyces caelestis TaxID=36816 RepID=A0A7W9H0H3_9ACTN|nr:hypothetical protein [Streptomyces caelestis]
MLLRSEAWIPRVPWPGWAPFAQPEDGSPHYTAGAVPASAYRGTVRDQ